MKLKTLDKIMTVIRFFEAITVAVATAMILFVAWALFFGTMINVFGVPAWIMFIVNVFAIYGSIRIVIFAWQIYRAIFPPPPKIPEESEMEEEDDIQKRNKDMIKEAEDE